MKLKHILIVIMLLFATITTAQTTKIANGGIKIGSTVLTATELENLDNTTSPVQTQLNGKIDTLDIAEGSWYSDAEINSLFYTKLQVDSIIESLFTGYLRSNGYTHTVLSDSIAPETWVSLGFDTDLISYINFEETTGTTFNNGVTESNDASVSAGSITINQIGQIGKAVYTNGTGQISTTAQTGLVGSINWTFAIWVKPTALSTNEIFTLFSPTSSTWVVAGLVSDGKVNLKVRTYQSPSIDSNTNSASSVINNNQWNLIAVTYNGTDVKLYVNNVEAISEYYAGGFNHYVTEGVVQYWCGTVGMTGYFDQTAVWNRLLSVTDLTNLYNLGLDGVGK